MIDWHECAHPKPLSPDPVQAERWQCLACGCRWTNPDGIGEPYTYPFRLTRLRESITADEVIKKLTTAVDEWKAERIFAVGLIEAAINQIQRGE